MLVRYRYRIDPTPGQRQALARAFGCARVVDNDALRERERAHQTGERLSDTEVQRRVVTLAKGTLERAWLAEVASVVLVQACQDARRAHRNWFDSRSGRRKGRRVGQPRFRTKRRRQSIRLTGNGFALHGTRLYVAKVGEVGVRWSREPPSAPSSVTVIWEPDGRYDASFVVRRGPTPLPPAAPTAALDLGLARFAVIVASDGSTEQIANPQHLRTAARRLAKSVYDAGRAIFVRLLTEKASRYGRTVVRVGRWEPTSQTCSKCGVKDGPKPLNIRTWTSVSKQEPTEVSHERHGSNPRRSRWGAGQYHQPTGPSRRRR